MFSDTFAGIAPASSPACIIAQILGGALAVVVIAALYPDFTAADAATVLVPHQTDETRTRPARAETGP